MGKLALLMEQRRFSTVVKARTNAGQKMMNLPIRPSGHLAQPRIYYVHPLMLKGFYTWKQVFEHASNLGFDTVLSAPLYKRGPGRSVFVAEDFNLLDPVLGLGDGVADGIRTLSTQAQDFGLNFMLDLVLDRGVADPSHYQPVDPRIEPQFAGSDSVNPTPDGTVLERWVDRIQILLSAGVGGFRCIDLERVPAEAWQTLLSAVRETSPEAMVLAWTPGTGFGYRNTLTGAGFDGCFSSLAWWDCGEPWFIEEYNLQRSFGGQIAFPEPPFSTRAAHGSDGHEILRRRSLRALQLAETLGDGLLVPMGFEYGASIPLDPAYGDAGGLDRFRDNSPFDLSDDVRAANTRIAARRKRAGSSIRLVTSGGKKAAAILQADGNDLRSSGKVTVTIVNKDLRHFTPVPAQAMDAALSGFAPIPAEEEALSRSLYPAEVRVVETTPTAPVEIAAEPGAVGTAVASPRIAIEDITPAVDDGRFPIKRIVGDIVRVEADIFADGHDLIAASLLWRAADEEAWHEVAMSLFANDRWFAEFSLSRMGRHEFVVQSWKNPFAIFRYELGKKSDAGLDLTLELEEGKALVRSVTKDAKGTLKQELEALGKWLSQSSAEAATALFLSPETSALMAAADLRPFLVQSKPYPVDAERKAAGFASWYQIFPRSQSGDPERHGTFLDVIGRLPAIRKMGFDVLYFPPIHPIGTTNRKGRNNSLHAGPDDPGSPYAIGSPEGGHEAIHPQLGTFEDFRQLVDEAAKAGLEIALDLAIQASPDHPWLKEHPGWFDWRPDGTIRYAENPPKKYEDIVNVDFYTKDAKPALWVELRDVVQGWVDRGVKLFRVDNPHTKPLPFWEWLIGDIRARHPDVAFLSEAFTRPKVMYRLAKVGFSQSYTYFTWRNEKWELEQYMRELTSTDAREFFRPHFFVNTHDINPDFLQNAPRPAYLIRAALAATLSGLWGVYNGFELCEGRPDVKRKEYADSEKYEIRAWDYDRPGNIVPEITMLNRIRSENSALHSHLGLTLLATSNEKIMFFEKADPGRDNVLLIAVCLDPYNVQEGDIEIPLWLWNQGDQGTLYAEDLVDGHRFSMRGKWHRLRLDPWALPFAIWRIRGET